MYYIIKLYPKLSAISISSALFQIFFFLACSVVEFSNCLYMSWSSLLLGEKKGLCQRHTHFCVCVCHLQRESL